MVRLIGAIALSVAVFSPAVQAQDISLSEQINQVFSGTQTINQTMATSGDDLLLNSGGNTPLASLTPLADNTPKLTQSGANTANLVNQPDVSVFSAGQSLLGQQGTTNSVELWQDSVLHDINQQGINIANAITAQALNSVTQLLDDSAVQKVDNSTTTGSAIGDLTQTGVNAANLAFVTESIGSGSQKFPQGAVQEINNNVALQNGASANSIQQTGVNIGNLLSADRVDQVTRVFAGTQKITNNVNFGSSQMPASITQGGVNVANLVVASQIGELHQISTGTQTTTNTVEDGTLQQYTDNPFGGVLTQQSNENYVNIVVLKGATQDGQNIVLSQQADFPQTNTGAPASQVGNTMSINE